MEGESKEVSACAVVSGGVGLSYSEGISVKGGAVLGSFSSEV
jgi:hypothetical protein